jgi:hypothetical protein
MIKRRFNRVGVDAGLIMICDKDFYKNYNYTEDKRLSKEFKLEPGVYDVKWRISESWNGDVSGEGVLDVSSGNVIISDPCYCIGGISDGFNDDAWGRILDETNYLNSPPSGTVVLDKMGGDGTYTVQVGFEKR